MVAFEFSSTSDIQLGTIVRRVVEWALCRRCRQTRIVGRRKHAAYSQIARGEKKESLSFLIAITRAFGGWGDKILRPFILRRMKREVATEMPDKIENIIKCDLSAWQKKMYRDIVEKGATVVQTSKAVSFKHQMNKVMQLRKVCNHPLLFDVESSYLDSGIDESIFRSSGKFELLDRILPKLKAAGHKVLLFSQMTALLDILQDFLEWRSGAFFSFVSYFFLGVTGECCFYVSMGALAHWIAGI